VRACVRVCRVCVSNLYLRAPPHAKKKNGAGAGGEVSGPSLALIFPSLRHSQPLCSVALNHATRAPTHAVTHAHSAGLRLAEEGRAAEASACVRTSLACTPPLNLAPSHPPLVSLSHARPHGPAPPPTHTQIGLRHFEVLPSTFEETLDKGAFPTGAAYAVATARAKAAQVAAGVRAGDSTRQALILAADTVVQAADGSILEKPDGEGDAARMLASLAGTTHAVHTGVSLVVLPAVAAGDGGEEATTAPRATFVEFSETTAVTFAPLSAAEIDAYVATGEADGKAGAYGIQGAPGAWVSRLEGCYFNVVGLPLHAVGREVAALVAAGVLV